MREAVPDGMQRGNPVRLEITKWGDLPHWEMDAVHLGTDRHGGWVGFPLGTHMSRPGMEFVTQNPQVGLVPGPGPAEGRGWLATFHGPGGNVWTYVDMTTAPVWDGPVLRCVDLDLDVIQQLDGSVYVDDEDEFAEHRVAYGYPPEVVALAERTCERVRAAMESRTPPYDGSAHRWLQELDRLAREAPR